MAIVKTNNGRNKQSKRKKRKGGTSRRRRTNRKGTPKKRIPTDSSKNVFYIEDKAKRRRRKKRAAIRRAIIQREGRKEPPKLGDWKCYFIRSLTHTRKTYVGKTNDLKRRIRQHNGELVGGARYTANRGPWKPFVVTKGFKYEHHCLQYEWAVQHRRAIGARGIPGRLRTLEEILTLKRVTSKAPLLRNQDLHIYTIFSKSQYCKYAKVEERVFDSLRLKREGFITYHFDQPFEKLFEK